MPRVTHRKSRSQIIWTAESQPIRGFRLNVGPKLGFWSSRQLLELLHQFGGDVQADILGERLTESSVSEIPRMHRELDLYPEVDQAIVLLTEGRKKK